MKTVRPQQSQYKQSKLYNQQVKAKSVELILPPAHPKQHELITKLDDDPALRFVVGACGSKFGKTYGATIALVKHAWKNAHSLNWWVAPSFDQSKMALSYVKRLLPKDMYVEYKADLKLVLLEPNGSEHSVIQFKSGDNEDTLRGHAVNFFILDEAARVKEASFDSIMTTLGQTMGKGIIISTPKGRGWFYDYYQRGEKFLEDGVTPKFGPGEVDLYPEWYSIRMPTWANPHVPLESIEYMRRNYPQDVFEQEVAAKFLLESAGVFRGIRDCLRGELCEPLGGHRYVMGVDLARLRDYTVLTVMDVANRHVVHQERFNQLAWEVQYSRIISTARKYRATVWIDSTGIGDPITQTIQTAGVRVEAYQISSSKAKQQLIDKLRVNIENQRISFPAGLNVLRRELESYEYKLSEQGVIKSGPKRPER